MEGWEFAVDTEAEAFCRRIARGLADRFGVPADTAVAVVNRLWRGQDFEPLDLRYHRTAEEWVNHFRFRAGVWPEGSAAEPGDAAEPRRQSGSGGV